MPQCLYKAKSIIATAHFLYAILVRSKNKTLMTNEDTILDIAGTCSIPRPIGILIARA